ncbi:MAG: hypothetical protein N3E47_08185, partial [Candidatus Bathyarchaeota archaeon]|nr:hypothetical protein [Candidatus Bathyarchaeota archaeon]
VLEKARARGVKIKLITYLDEDSYTFGEKSSILNVAEVRHVDIEYTGVDFMATDTGESLLCCFPSDFLGESNTQIQGLWSNSISFAHILRAVFMELWSKTISSAERLMEIQFRRAVKEMPETLGSIAGEKGLLLEMPVVIKGMSGLKHRFDLALRKRGSEGELVVGDALPEKGDVKEALISLYLKAMDVKAHQKLFIVSREEKLSAEERELAATYSIKLIDGLEPAELSRKIMERIL